MDSSSRLKEFLSPQEVKAVQSFQKAVKTAAKGKLRRLLLFGSRARGEGNQDSDVDILVLLSVIDDSLKTEIWDMAHRIFCDTDIMISPLVLSEQQFARLISLQRLIAQSIQKEGIPL